MLSDEQKRKHNLKMYIYVYVSNCSSAVFEALVECFVRQIKEEMWAECTDGGRGDIGLWANPENIPCTVEDQAFSPSPPPLPPASCISVSVFLCVAADRAY
jgi:hypothetical protein